MMARLLPSPDRVSLFHGVLRTVIDSTSPDALVFKHSQQVIAPADYLAACSEEPIQRPGSLNVRFFNITDSDGEMLMDTRGMQEIGLHDLQCHYRNLDPKEVARVLFNTAFYIFENGAVIESGQTVEGIEADSKWRCQFETSILEPKRRSTGSQSWHAVRRGKTMRQTAADDYSEAGIHFEMRGEWTCGVSSGWNGSVARGDRHGQIAADGSCQMSLDFVVPGNSFLAASLRVGPDGMAAAFANRHAAMFL